MLTPSHRRQLWAVVLLPIAFAIFFAARIVAIQRPKYLGIQPNKGNVIFSGSMSQPIGGDAMELSPDGRWLRAQCGGERMYIWNVQQRAARPCYLHEVKFSADSQTLAGALIKPIDSGRGANSLSAELQTLDGRKIWTSVPIRIRESIMSLDFVGQAIQITATKHIYRFDLKTGKLIGAPANPDQKNADNWFDTNARKSPDGTLSYALLPGNSKRAKANTKHRVQVTSVRSPSQSWSYPAKILYNFGQTYIACVPHWEEDGKTLATIENDTLYLYESQTGKLILKQKNNLPAPLQSWAFTRDRNGVYLMDTKGEIFLQHLS